MEAEAILNIMKKLFVVVALLIFVFQACNSKKPIVETIVEVAVDAGEEILKSETGIDVDLNGNGK